MSSRNGKPMRRGRGLVWTDSEVEILRMLYPTTSTGRLSEILNRSRHSIYMKAFVLGLTKCPEYLADPAKSGRFTRNSRPNGYPGNLLMNKPAPIGSVRLNSDGTFVVKFTDKHKDRQQYKNWMPLLRFIWEQSGRSVPDGEFVTFKEGRKTTDPDSITVEMLECVTMSECVARRNRRPKHIRQLESTIREILKETQRANRRTSQGESK